MTRQVTLTILAGKNRSGEKEGFDSMEIRPGDTISIVGPTGSGKLAFINDIETLAQGDTVTGRTVLVNGDVPPESFIRDPAFKPIALITQNTRCLADLSVEAFLTMYIKARRSGNEELLYETIDLANPVTGVLECHTVGPMAARKEDAHDVQAYHVHAFEGIANPIKKPPVLGTRQYFLPGYCMLDLAHTALVNMILKKPSGIHVRLEDIRIL
jgi:hypothetical protein